MHRPESVPDSEPEVARPTARAPSRLSIGLPDDPAERAADRVAAAAMRSDGRAAGRELGARPRAGGTGGSGARRAPSVPASVQQVLRGAGQPLDAASRGFMEPRLGADLGRVRVHSGPAAVRSARDIRAAAYSAGGHVVFGEGYVAGSAAGRRLLAHELAHTLQVGSESVLRRQEVTVEVVADPLRPYKFKVPPGVTTRREMRLYVEVQVFGRVVNLDWKTSFDPDEDVSNRKKPMHFTFHQSVLDRYGVGGSAGGAEAKKQAEAEFKALPPEDRDAVVAETDRRYAAATGQETGTKIESHEKGKKVVWHALKRAVLADRRTLEQLPETVKGLLGEQNFTPENYGKLVEVGSELAKLSDDELTGFFEQSADGIVITPADYPKLLEIAKKLAAMSPEARADYLNRVNAAAPSLDSMNASLDRYLVFRKLRELQFERHEEAAEPLLGSEDLYTAYRTYKAWQRNLAIAGALRSSARDPGQAADSILYLQKNYDAAKAALMAALAHKGFGSIAEFEAAIEAYRQAFRNQAVSLALDVLDRYDHMLYMERQRLKEPGAAAAIVQRIAAGKAKENFAEAKSKRVEAAMHTIGNDHGDTDWIEHHLEASRAADAAKKKAESAVLEGAGEHEIIKQPGVDLEDVAGWNAAKMRTELDEILTARGTAVATARAELATDPERVFSKPDLVAATRQMLFIGDDSVYGRIIADYIADEGRKHFFGQLALGALGAALTFLVPGGGWIAAAAIVGQVGISSYQAYEAYKDYQTQYRDYELGFLQEEPSLFWVGFAIAAAALELGVSATILIKNSAPALKGLKGPLEDFAKDGNAGRLLAQIEAAEGLDDTFKAALAREAAAAKAARTAWKELAGMGGKLNAFAGLVDPGVARNLYRALYHSVKRGANTIIKLRADAKFLDIAGDLTRMSGAERKQLEAAFSEVKEVVQAAHARGMDESSLVGYLDRLAINRGRPGFKAKLLDDVRAWKPLTPEQAKALRDLERQRGTLRGLYDQKAHAQKRLRELRAQPTRDADDIAEIRELEQDLKLLDPTALPQRVGAPKPPPGQIAQAEQRLLDLEEAAAKANLTTYDRLRRAVPATPVRDRVLRGVTTDQVGPLKTKPQDLTVEHIVSVREISDMDGFEKLLWKDQKAITDMRQNLVVMDSAANSSKGERTWRSWRQASHFYDESTIASMAKRESEVRALIQAEINKRLPK